MGKVQVQCFDRFRQVMGLGRSDDGCGEAVAGALGNSIDEAYRRWHEWAPVQRDFICNGKPGIIEGEYEAVARRFGALGIKRLV